VCGIEAFAVGGVCAMASYMRFSAHYSLPGKKEMPSHASLLAVSSRFLKHISFLLTFCEQRNQYGHGPWCQN